MARERGISNRQISSLERKRRKRRRRQKGILFFVLVLILAALIGAIFFFGSYGEQGKSAMDLVKKGVSMLPESVQEKVEQISGLELETETESETETEMIIQTEVQTELQTEGIDETRIEEVLEEAESLAITYDYEGAIQLLKAEKDYNDSSVLQEKVDSYQAQKDACVAFGPEEVTHIFYHSLVVDPARAFDPDKEGYDGWQQWMTTVSEFDKITQSMYDRGYVLVSIHDLVTKSVDENGNVIVEPAYVYLPEGKKPFVLSLDDLSYYHTYDDRGVASKIVLDDEGKPTCEYYDADGNLLYGDYDVVPRMDSFLEEHPDGCYKGARGIIALTGYNGVLGYRTDGTYSEEHNERSDVYYVDDLQLAWLDKHPDYDWDTEVAEATKVANAMKAEGWEFASHTWGHKNIAETSYDDVVRDTERWLKYVGGIVGETDAIIFAHGADIAVGEYSEDDPKYTYLKEKGFDIYCNVDSVRYTTNVYSGYLHQGRRNLDGYRIYNDYIDDSGDPITSDLFDASEVLDPDRPLPVPDL